ncbi:MAG: ATP-binding protein [Candidatus Glassbacteria bacterium]
MRGYLKNRSPAEWGGGRTNIATKLLLLLILMTLVPVGITAVLMFTTAKQIQKVALDEGKAALVEKFESYLSDRTRDYAEGLGKELLRIEGEARAVASIAAALYSNPQAFEPDDTRTYTKHDLGFFWSPLQEGSNLFAGAGVEVNERFMEEVRLTEYLDPILENTYEEDENVAYVYFTSRSKFSRGYPWFDAQEVVRGGTLPPDLDVETHPIYYRADPSHNPEREVVWSDVYLDVAGRGFMVTCSCPVYTDDNWFCGVVGIDVTVERLSNRIHELEAGEAGYAFLIRGDGSVIAFTENASQDLGYDASVRPDRFNLFERAKEGLHGVLDVMSTGSSGIRWVVVEGNEKIVAFYPVVPSNWMLGLVVPVEWVTRAALKTGEKMRERTDLLRAEMFLFFFLLVTAVVLVTFMVSRKVARPVRELAEGARRIGSGDLGYRVSELSNDEIGDLAHSFNEMATSLREREEELARIQQELIMSESLSSMGKVAAGVAHEIRNALGVIKNSIYYLDGKLETGIEKENQAQVEKHMEIIEREIEIAEGIISELLNFASPLVAHVKELDLCLLIREAVDRTAFPAKTRVKLDFPAETLMIRGDPVLLGQVFFNILQNAKQAMPDGGEVTVSMAVEETEISVKISDTGVGINPENIEMLFEPFFTTKAKGIGLGLSLSKRIIEEHKGRIEVESTEGEGTCFTIHLPK